jgi:glycosyltransferase involved in cell wall biosynthesis
MIGMFRERGAGPSISVDASALHSPLNGISRYLGETLGRMLKVAETEYPSLAWRVYCRHAINERVFRRNSVTFRRDYMPASAGRVLAPFVSSPVFSWRDNPDVFWGPAHRLPLWLPSSTKAVVTVHDLAWMKAPETMRKGGRFLDRVMMPPSVKRAAVIITVSQSTANELISLWPDSEGKILVTPLGPSLFRDPVSLKSLGFGLVERGYFLFVGTIEPRKNLERLLRAHALGAAGRIDWPPLIVVGGEGWGLDSLSSLVKRIGCDRSTMLLGRVSDRDLAALYANAIAFLMPSIYEGFGLPIVEAMSFGTPVLTSNTSSMPEVVGDAGILVDPLSVDSIYAGLSEMLDNTAHRQFLSCRAKERSLAYSWDKTAQLTLGALVKLASLRKSS